MQTIGDDGLLNSQWSIDAELENGGKNISFKYEDKDSTPLIAKLMLDISGTEPSEVKGFFVRSISNGQGTREEEMTFTKLADGSWTAEYKFTAPGTYYLRNLQLNGVNYSLSEPITVEITGFALTGVTWSENGENVIYRTSEGTHTTDVTVSFASSEQYQMPHEVQARFVRDDGNTVNVALSYDGGGDWKGTANFSTSGKYTLEYLVYTVIDEKTGESKNVYYALGNKAKTIDLALGLYVVVTNQSGQETVDYDSGKTFEWDVLVDIFDNAGNRLDNMENVRLVYSNNGSASNTVKVDLTPNFDQYVGTLAIHGAGRWIFGYLEMDGQILTKATSSPTFTVISPDPVKFNTSSVGSYYGKTQYKPLTNDAIIDGIKISNSDAATIEAIVYNSISKKYERVTWEKVSHVNDKVSVTLPQYTMDLDEDGKPLDGATYSQEGTWELVALILTNCYAEDSLFHDETNPVVWANQEHKAYFESQAEEENAIVVTEYLDLSKMTTKVSSKMNVTMISGNTTLGGTNAEFMKQFALKDIGMQVVLTDAEGNQIPASEVAANITLNISYVPPTASNAYGYKVQSGAGKNYAIKLTNVNAENGTYVVSDGSSVWQYVGEYTVKSLSVTIGGQTLTLTPDGSNGVPTKYTVTTQTYDAGDITPIDIKQGSTVFGKTGDNITGTFLLSYNLEQFNIKFKLNAQAVDGTQYVVLEDDDVTAQLELTHTGGSSQNGGYSFTDSEYTNITVPMSNSNGLYRASASVLLAGNYNAQIRYTIAGTEKVETLKSISVYSKKPDVTMELGSGTPTTVTVNKDGGTAASTNTFTGNNLISNNGHSAVLFAAYQPFTKEENPGTYKEYNQNGAYASEFANYDLPQMVFTLADVGDKGDFALNISGMENSISLVKNGSTGAVDIGTIRETTEGRSGSYIVNLFGIERLYDCTYQYKTEKLDVVGSQYIDTITATYNGYTYTMSLGTRLSIVETNQTVPSITFDMSTNHGFTIPVGMTSTDGRSFTFTLPESLKTTDGKLFSVESIKRTTTTTQATGEDPNKKAEDTGFDSAIWETIKTVDTRNVFTVDSEILSGTHNVSIFGVKFSGTYYWKKLSSKLYTLKYMEQSAMLTVSVIGLTVEVKTTEYLNIKWELDYWLVDGNRCEPGTTITVDGNSVVIPVYKSTEEMTGKTVVTTTVNGTTNYFYKAYCDAQQATYVGTGASVESSKRYCSHSSCRYITNSGKSDAENELLEDPVNTGYEKVDSVSESIQRDFTDSQWERYGDPVVEDGEKTVNTKVYDANGKLISETNG